MQKLWIIIWRFSPLHIWHISLINYSLDNYDKTIVIIWSADKIDEKNPYSLNKREDIIKKEFEDKILLDYLKDSERDDEWISNLDLLIKKYSKNQDEINFLWWDLWNDYAIKIIKEYLYKFNYEKVNFYEKSRQEIPISATEVRLLLKQNNLEEAKKWLSEKTTLLIINK